MLEAQQAALPQPNPASSLPDDPGGPADAAAGDSDGYGDDEAEVSTEMDDVGFSRRLA